MTVPAPMTLHDGKVVGVKEDSMQTDTMLLLVSKVFQIKSCNGKTCEFLVGLGRLEIVCNFITILSCFVLKRGNVSNFSCHSHSALYNVYPVALDRTKR